MSFAPEIKPVAQMANGEAAVYGDDRKLYVSFSREPVKMEHKSTLAGREVYEDRDFITIVQPGAKSDMKRQVIMESRGDVPSDPDRFPRQWAAFKNETQEVHDGLPLEQWPPIGKSQVLAFKGARIFTVEMLSALPDSALQTVAVLDARKYRDMAIAYMDRAKDAAPITALTAENEALKQQMAIMQEQIAALAANQKKTPGRKPNQPEEGED